MSLESIISHIVDKTNKEIDEIIQKAKEEKEDIIRQAKEEAKKLYEAKMAEETRFCENLKEKIIVNARLEAKKELLNTKQKLIEEVLEKYKPHINKSALKKTLVKREGVEEVSEKADFYLDKIRLGYETEIAKILFT